MVLEHLILMHELGTCWFGDDFGRLKKWKNSGKVTALFVSPRSGKSWGLLLCDTNMQLRHRKQLSGLMVCGPNVDTDPNLQHVKVHWQLHQRLETLSYK
ncbi:uncharacterized protein LOC133722411 isoform X3 [Rosa rugosa]|uniref:uncharacterized protein LOC133722411 isoform X3 n=1 Tax=Rosa rugosa TaxID=74645 RepID=UPI002B415BF2|nr:uncharacterized protein LOC133722411 isoform X3 [Rosa rugosa]